MSIYSILCAYSGEQTKAAALKHAIKLAKHYGAEITGVISHGRSVMERQFASQLPENLIEVIQRNDDAQISMVRQRFHDMLGEAGMNAQAEFIELNPERDGLISEVARAFDLVITGAHSDLANESHLSAHPDLVALRSGRPVLVVPDDYQADALAERAVIAWDGKRAAARAVGDAMDHLTTKASVTLLCVGQEPRNTAWLLANMQRHGIEVSLKVLPRKGPISATILHEAAELDARLIVMGAFEHSKFSHDLIGGVTTDVIRDSKVPVFMAH